MPMTDVAPIIAGLEQSRSTLLAVAARMPADLWQKPPRPGAWSAAEVFAHLWMVEDRTAGTAARLILASPKPVPFWKRLHLPVWLLQARWLKVRTPIPLVPALVAEKEASISRHAELRARSLVLLQQQAHRDLSEHRFPHPFLGNLNFYERFRMIAHHEIRHQKQLQEIVENLRNS